MNEYPSFDTDVELYLCATRFLAELQGEEKPFEYLNSSQGFPNEPVVAARFEEAFDREFGPPEKEAICRLMGIICLVHHHNYDIDHWSEIMDDFTEDEQDFLRTVSWAFINAWTHRYGGFYGDLAVKGGALIDPSSLTPT